MPNQPLPPLVTVDALAGRLGVPSPADALVRGKWTGAVTDASGAVRSTIGQPITPGSSVIPLKIDRYGQALIPLSPVVQVTALADANGTDVPTDGTGFEVYGQRLTIYPRWLVANPYQHLDPVYQVTVSHGWDPVPDEILRWAYSLAAAQLQAALGGSLGLNGGPTSVSVDDGRMTFAELAGMIPDRERERLRATYGGEQ